jgi:maleylpyruvate isomerase
MMSWSATDSPRFEQVFAILRGPARHFDPGHSHVANTLTGHRQPEFRHPFGQDGVMADPHPHAAAARLLPDATRRLIRTADGLADTDYAQPSGLPGWTRGHVLAHLALNAEGLAGALGGVVDGQRASMYASQEARDADVAELAGAEPAAIRSRLLGACTDLFDALDAVPPDQADTSIDRVPGGRTFTVSAVPGMRLGEVEIHHADLDAGYGPGQWPTEFTLLMLDRMLVRGGAETPFQAHAVDLGRTWSLGEGGPTVSGTAAALAWWLTGRGAGDGLASEGGDLPQIGAW